MAIASAPSGDILTFDSGPLQARIFQGSGHLALAGPDLAGTPHANVLTFEPPVVTVRGRAQTVGRVVSSSPLPDGFELVQDLGGTNITARLTFPADGVLRYEVTDWNGPLPDQTSVSAASDDSEHFYGFGEKFDTFDQAGRFVRTQTFDHPGNKGDRSYKTAPWFLSTRGYGFYLESSTESHFDMRSGSRDGYVVTNLFSTLRFNIVYGPRLTDALSRYTGLTGRPSLPPPFAFGPWISSDVWRTGGEVRYAVEKFRQADVNIPASAFVFDSPWESNYNDFTFNLKGPGTQLFDGGTFKGKPFTLEGKSFPGFATVDEMMEFFRGHGLKVILWMTPFVNVSSDNSEVAGQEPGKARNYDEGEKIKGVFPLDRDGKALLVNWWKGVGSPVDFTTPVGRDWVTKQIEALVESSEVVTRSGAREPVIGGFKTDDGESLTDPGANKNKEGVYIPLDARYADGRTGRELRNAYCVGYHETIHGVLGQKGVLLARSGFTGSQAFPGYWAGDNEPNFGPENGLPSVITAGMSAAMSGFSIWGHDIGGYQNNNFSHSPADLFRRWAQFGCFSPLMQMHRQVNPDDLRQYPWGYPEGGKNTALENYQFYSRLHIQLFPYIYTYANESSTTGLPILRPLVLLNQDDPQTFTVDGYVSLRQRVPRRPGDRVGEDRADGLSAGRPVVRLLDPGPSRRWPVPCLEQPGPDEAPALRAPGCDRADAPGWSTDALRRELRQQPGRRDLGRQPEFPRLPGRCIPVHRLRRDAGRLPVGRRGHGGDAHLGPTGDHVEGPRAATFRGQARRDRPGLASIPGRARCGRHRLVL